jgi:transcriptional regulator with XRE-family HTH domain
MSLLPERLREARDKKGLSQRELGELSGVSSRMIYRYEADIADPTSTVLMRMATALGVSTDYLLGLVTPPTEIFRDEKLSEEEYRLVQSYRQGDMGTLMAIGSDRVRQLSNKSADEEA